MQFMNQQLTGGQRFGMSSEEIDKTLRLYNDFKTWGFLGDPNDDSPINSYFLVPKKNIIAPPNQPDEGAEVDYQELSCVIKNGLKSYFCCEYHYSYDEFRKSKNRGTFKIEICKENKLILDWIVKKRFLVLMNKSPKTFEALDIDSLLNYFLKNPSFMLPLKDISGLAFDDNYMNLIN